jgi:hypothetical protein
MVSESKTIGAGSSPVEHLYDFWIAQAAREYRVARSEHSLERTEESQQG